MSDDGIRSITMGYYAIDIAACTYTLSCGVSSLRQLAFKPARVEYTGVYGIMYAEQHVKFVYDAATCTGPVVSGSLDAWFIYSDLKAEVKVMTSTEYERERSRVK